MFLLFEWEMSNFLWYKVSDIGLPISFGLIPVYGGVSAIREENELVSLVIGIGYRIAYIAGLIPVYGGVSAIREGNELFSSVLG